MVLKFALYCFVFRMMLGYVYPAYECYKAVEMNKPEIEQLRFWCQYWSVSPPFCLLSCYLFGYEKPFWNLFVCYRILVALLSVFERIGDAFISW